MAKLELGGGAEPRRRTPILGNGTLGGREYPPAAGVRQGGLSSAACYIPSPDSAHAAIPREIVAAKRVVRINGAVASQVAGEGAGQTNVQDAAVPFDAVHVGLESKRSQADASAESHPAERAMFQGRKGNRDDSLDTLNAKMAKLSMCREEVLGELSNRMDQLRGEVWLELNTHMD
ncbi:hypothetical protein PG991_006735 [Apiospora marii]|uniref:Uncharacterized protein n=1 Tax=Apiospora marii TaxID=335849 RepID=A0ABR1RY63_9PEZI